MKSSNVKHPIEWVNVSIDELQINGVKVPVRVNINTPKGALYIVTYDSEGKEISKVHVPIEIPNGGAQ